VAVGKENDVAVGISKSGNSPNMLHALEVAKSKSMYTIALTGATGGKIKAMAGCTLVHSVGGIPSHSGMSHPHRPYSLRDCRRRFDVPQ
jgi:phosphoheptose isomerase